MDNSFYYFFSATPQVLGGILALFGVFTIFKIQILSEVLTKKSNEIYQDARTWYPPDFDKDKIKIGVKVHKDIKEGLEQKDFRKIKSALDLNEKEKIPQEGNYKRHSEEFLKIFPKREEILNKTINYSTVTAAIIVFCLAIIPLGNLLLCHQSILIAVFIAVIIGIIYSFYKMISILKQVFIE